MFLISAYVFPILFCAAVSLDCTAEAKREPCHQLDSEVQRLRRNMFNAQQEVWLGEIVSARIRPQYRIVHDPALASRLDTILEQLTQGLPAGCVKFHVEVIDSEDVNALGLPDGSIFLTSSLIHEAKVDDELAFVLAHEIGHTLAHHFATQTTIEFERVLGVRTVAGRADIQLQYLKLQKLGPDSRNTEDSVERDQEEADHIGLEMMTAAGYRPSASEEFWSRIISDPYHHNREYATLRQHELEQHRLNKLDREVRHTAVCSRRSNMHHVGSLVLSVVLSTVEKVALSPE